MYSHTNFPNNTALGHKSSLVEPRDWLHSEEGDVDACRRRAFSFHNTDKYLSYVAIDHPTRNARGITAARLHH